MLSRIAREHAAEIAAHDWSDAPWRLDRAGHDRQHDTNKGTQQLTEKESDRVRTNAMWVTAQVLAYSDPHFDVVEFARACGVQLSEGGLRAGLRGGAGQYARPGSWEYDPIPEPNPTNAERREQLLERAGEQIEALKKAGHPSAAHVMDALVSQVRVLART
jgi:hypothetical protein